MSSNLPLIRRSRRVLPWSGGLKLETNIPLQQIHAKWKGGLMSSEYSTYGSQLFLHFGAYSNVFLRCDLCGKVCPMW